MRIITRAAKSEKRNEGRALSRSRPSGYLLDPSCHGLPLISDATGVELTGWEGAQRHVKDVGVVPLFR